MKQFEAPQKPKEYNSHHSQDHGTRGNSIRWSSDEQYDIDKPLAHQEFITKQDINDGLEDYHNTNFTIEPSSDEPSVFEDLERELGADELVYTTDVNRLPDSFEEIYEVDRHVIEIDDFDNDGYEVQVFSGYVRNKRKAREATLDNDFAQEDFGDDFPHGMHITNRP